MWRSDSVQSSMDRSFGVVVPAASFLGSGKIPNPIIVGPVLSTHYPQACARVL